MKQIAPPELDIDRPPYWAGDPETEGCLRLAGAVLKASIRDYRDGPGDDPHDLQQREWFEDARDFFADTESEEPFSFFWICQALCPARPKRLRAAVLRYIGCCVHGLDERD